MLSVKFEVHIILTLCSLYCCVQIEEKNSDVEEEVEEEQVSEEEGVDEEKEWKELQESVKRDKESLKGEASESPVVHAPYYPKVSY